MNNLYTVSKKEIIAKDVYKFTLLGDTSKITKPGQFINIKVEGFYLRRPISVCSYNEDSLVIVFKVFGQGTKKLANYEVSDKVDCLVGLGNGFDVISEKNSLIIAGGVGTPPMIELSKRLIELGNDVTVLLGYQTMEDVMLEDEFKSLGCNIYIATIDGTSGFKGNVLELFNSLNLKYNTYYACGPNRLLKALQNNLKNGYISLEERMACGFGACMGCSCKTSTGYKRICKEGPVFIDNEVEL